MLPMSKYENHMHVTIAFYKSNTVGCESINSKIINTYFTGIFQSKNTKNNPTISDVMPMLQDYNMYVPILDGLYFIRPDN